MAPASGPGRARSRPNFLIGVAASVLLVAAATAAIYPLKALAPVASLSVVYLPAVLLVSTYWGLALGLLTALLSAAAFNFFHLPPTGRFTIADSRNWVALGAFTLVAVAVSTVADLARAARSRPSAGAPRPISPRRWRASCLARTPGRAGRRRPPGRRGARDRPGAIELGAVAATGGAARSS